MFDYLQAGYSAIDLEQLVVETRPDWFGRPQSETIVNYGDPDAGGATYTSLQPLGSDHGHPRFEPAETSQNDSVRGQTIERREALLAFLSIEAWAERNIPEPDCLLGHVLTTTTRMFLVGRTGLGKTLFALAIAASVASGSGFLHWRSARAGRVVYIDGEMPAELIKPRSRDAIRRLKGVEASIPSGNLLIFGRDIEAQARRICPDLPPFAPLNTQEGQIFLLKFLEAIGGVDLIIFDNVMSLTIGDQKDELPWSNTLPMVGKLTDLRIGQVWIDHTGHNSSRQYGSSTKAWQFDVVACMTAPGGRSDPREIAFELSFDHPGKARRRTPENWQQFEPQIIRLTVDQWSSEPAKRVSGQMRPAAKMRPLKPAAEKQYDALLTAAAGAMQVTRLAWYEQCVRQGIAKLVPNDVTSQERSRLTGSFRARIGELKNAGLISVNGESVIILIKGQKVGDEHGKIHTATQP